MHHQFSGSSPHDPLRSHPPISGNPGSTFRPLGSDPARKTQEDASGEQWEEGSADPGGTRRDHPKAGSEFGAGIWQLLFREAPGMVRILPLLAVVFGLLTIALISAGQSLIRHNPEATYYLAVVIVLLGLGKLLSGSLAESMVARLSFTVLARFRERLARLVLAVPLRQYERARHRRILAGLTEHVSSISQMLAAIPALVMNLAIIAGGASFLLMLSPVSFIILTVYAAIGIFIYFPLARACQRSWSATIHEDDEFCGHLNKLQDGIEELKLNRHSRESFLAECLSNTNLAHCYHRVAATRRNTLLLTIGYLLAFLLLGLILFILPQYGLLDQSSSSAYVIASVFLYGPVAAVLHALPLLLLSRTALRQLRQFENELALESSGLDSTAQPAGEWSTISLLSAEVCFDGDERCAVGPVDLLIERSELIYITGENGSGKSTLGRMLCGLYSPDAGEVLLDGKEITDENRDTYRQHFATIFSDRCRFDELLGIPSEAVQGRARLYLQSLNLDHAVAIREGRFITTGSLSQRQSKRLALLAAYLEDREIYLFDEWAADEEPEFKEMFYNSLLPDLHASGKTVIVITGDERFLKCAPRVIEMENGLIIQDRPQVSTTPRKELIALN